MAGESPWLGCVFPEMPLPGPTPTCDTAGVLNGIVGTIAGVASTEALKLLLKSERASRAMFWMDLWENTSERIELPSQPDCPTCRQHHSEFLDSLSRTSIASPSARATVQVPSVRRRPTLTPPALPNPPRPAPP